MLFYFHTNDTGCIKTDMRQTVLQLGSHVQSYLKG